MEVWRRFHISRSSTCEPKCSDSGSDFVLYPSMVRRSVHMYSGSVRESVIFECSNQQAVDILHTEGGEDAKPGVCVGRKQEALNAAT